MKRIYADLHLCPNVKDLEHVSNLVNKASRLGYSLMAITFPVKFANEEMQRILDICEQAKIDFVSRVDLKPKTPKELLHNLRKLRRKFEIIAVICESKNVARQAAKDRRVDLLNFPSIDFHRRFFDRAEAELASKGLASLEIDTKPLLTSEGKTRIRLISNLRREATIAKEYNVPIVISSGVSDEMLMRKPKEMAALAFLFNLDENFARNAVSLNPALIVKRNREKLSPRFVAPGIRIIRRGRDC